MTSQSTEVEKKFQEFNFAGSVDWQTFFSGLYPTPCQSKVQKYKRKWYKRSVDDALSLDEEPERVTTGSTSSTSSVPTSRHSSATVVNTTGPLATASFASGLVGIVCAVVYVLPLLKVSNKAYRFSLGAFCVSAVTSLLNTHGMVKFNQTYMHKILQDDLCFVLLFAIIFFPCPPFVLILIPPALTTILQLIPNVAIRRNSIQNTIARIAPSMASAFQSYFQQMQGDSFKFKLMGLRADAEVAIGFFVVLLAFMRRMPLLTIMLFWSFLRMRYMMNSFTQHTFRKIDSKITTALGASFVPRIVSTIYQKIRTYSYSYVDPTQQSSGPGGCSIM